MKWQDILAHRDPVQQQIQDAYLETYKKSKEGQPETPVFESMLKNPPVTKILEGTENVFNLAWKKHQQNLKKYKLDSMKSSWALSAWNTSQIATQQPTPESIYRYLDRMSTEVAMQKMDKKSHLARTIWTHRHELFGNNETTTKDAIAFALTDDLILEDCQAVAPSALSECEEKMRLTRRKLYGDSLVVMAENMNRVAADPAFIDLPECDPEIKTLALLKSYDLLANKLRFPSDLAMKNNAQRASLLKLCRHLIENPRADLPGLWRDMSREAERVQTMIRSDLFTPAHLKNG